MFTHRHLRRVSSGRSALATAAAALALAACGSDDSTPSLELSLQGLESLGPQAVYEGWLLVDGAPVSSGRFSVDDQGRASQTRFDITAAQADRATAFVLTIEPAQGDIAAPTDTHLLAGDFVGGNREASLGIAHAAALGTDLSTARGSFFLATPTSASLDDEAQGLWWVQVVDGAPQPGLMLPTLPAGWIYEGWVVVNGTPISTGRFSSAAMPDSDAAGPAAGPLGAPPFPGQDFVTPPRALPGGAAVISIEPVPDNSPAPFTLKPLAGPIAAGTGPAVMQSVANTVGNGSSLPRGTARLIR
jgi:hypothetical protein